LGKQLKLRTQRKIISSFQIEKTNFSKYYNTIAIFALLINLIDFGNLLSKKSKCSPPQTEADFFLRIINFLDETSTRINTYN